MYNKLFTKILDSSIWLEPTPTRIVWITFIAAMDSDGFVQFATVGNVANRALVSIEEAEAALQCLEGPDTRAPGQEYAGRRIERVPGGWMVLNSKKYRDIIKAEAAREATRLRVAKHRREKSNADVTVSNEKVTPSEAVAVAVSEAEAVADPDQKQKKKSTPPTPSRGKRALRAPTPEDRIFSEAHLATAVKYGCPSKPVAEATFEEWWAWADANGRAYADWGAGWRTWCMGRRDGKFGKGWSTSEIARVGGGPPPTSFPCKDERSRLAGEKWLADRSAEESKQQIGSKKILELFGKRSD